MSTLVLPEMACPAPLLCEVFEDLKVTRYDYEAYKRSLTLGIDHYPFDPKRTMDLPLEAPTRVRPDIALPWPLCAACSSLN